MVRLFKMEQGSRFKSKLRRGISGLLFWGQPFCFSSSYLTELLGKRSQRMDLPVCYLQVWEKRQDIRLTIKDAGHIDKAAMFSVFKLLLGPVASCPYDLLK